MVKESVQEYYDSFGLFQKGNKDINKIFQANVWKVPTKDVGANKTHMDTSVEPGQIQQADVLYLPQDRHYKYALVVVDTASRQVEAEPITKVDTAHVLEAFKKIYKRDVLSPPEFMIQVDSGSEFKGIVKEYFEDKDIIVRVAKTGRHRQQGVVENYNRIIAKGIFNRQYAKEINTGEDNTQWTKDLPFLIKWINQNAKARIYKFKSASCTGTSCQLLEEGTKVRVILEEPREYLDNTKLHGRFRATDMRFDLTPREIKHIIIKPNSPPLYIVSGFPTVGYTKNQLSVIPEDEELPPKKFNPPQK